MPSPRKAPKKEKPAPAPKKAAKAPAKAAKAPPPKKAAPPKPQAPAPKPPEPAKAVAKAPAKAPFVEDPTFVRQAPAAERKAALESILSREGVPEALPTPPKPTPPPFVKESSAAARKAAVEQLAEESGVKGLLAKAPWKRGPEPAAPAGPPQPAAPAPKDAPRAIMTKAPLEQTTGRNPPSVVLLDTNALMMQFQFHIDIEKEVNRLLNGNYHYVVPQIVVDELSRLAKEGGSKEAAEARMAAELAKTFEVVESPGDGDTGILRLAEKINAIVVTNDKKLRAQLRAKDIPNIYMRSRAFLTIEGHIPGM